MVISPLSLVPWERNRVSGTNIGEKPKVIKETRFLSLNHT